MRLYAFGMPRSASTWWFDCWREIADGTAGLEVPNWRSTRKHAWYSAVASELGEGCRVAAIYRDIRDVLVSAARRVIAGGHVTGKSLSEVVDEHLDLALPRPWALWLRSWWDKPCVDLFKYEAVTRAPGETFCHILGRCGLPVDKELVRRIAEAHSFERMHAADWNHYPRGEIGQWKTLLSPEQVARLEREYGECLDLGGYERAYA